MNVLLFFIVLILVFIALPIIFRVRLNLRVLTMSGRITMSIFRIINITIYFQIRGEYIIIRHNNKTTRQKLTDNDINIVFVKKLVSMFYFRQNVTDVIVMGSFGYKDNAMVTAVMSSVFGTIANAFLCVLKNNKQSANIKLTSLPNYDKDICSLEMTTKFNISIFDTLFVFALTLIRLLGGKYERRKTHFKENRVANR